MSWLRIRPALGLRIRPALGLGQAKVRARVQATSADEYYTHEFCDTHLHMRAKICYSTVSIKNPLK